MGNKAAEPKIRLGNIWVTKSDCYTACGDKSLGHFLWDLLEVHMYVAFWEKEGILECGVPRHTFFVPKKTLELLKAVARRREAHNGSL